MISDWSTAMTFLAPALAANMERIPVPHPTSSTTCGLKEQRVTFPRYASLSVPSWVCRCVIMALKAFIMLTGSNPYLPKSTGWSTMAEISSLSSTPTPFSSSARHLSIHVQLWPAKADLASVSAELMVCIWAVVYIVCALNHHYPVISPLQLTHKNPPLKKYCSLE